MTYAIDKLKKQIIEAVVKAAGSKVKTDQLEITTPPESDMGDLAVPCFSLAKILKKKPNEIAEDLASKVKVGGAIKEVKAVGPYLNFVVDPAVLGKEVVGEINKAGDKYGQLKSKRETIVVEYSSPNTNKPIHVGHFRNTLLGHAVSLLLTNQGHKVIQANLINDRGVHISKSMYAYQKYGKDKQPDKKSDHFVGDFYVLYAKHETESTKKIIQEMLQKWERGDSSTISLWKKMNKWALDGFKQTYERLGIKFDKYYLESNHYNEGKDTVREALKKKIFNTDENENIVAKLDKYQLPDKVVLRADGTSVYVTQDIHLAKLKFDDYKFDRSVYVVGNEQDLHFKQLFKILDLLGYKWSDRCHHLSYGMVNLPDGKMKSREGKVVDGDDLMDEIVGVAKKEIKARHKKLGDKELDERAEKIGIGAIRFHLLKTDPVKNIMYDPKESISFDGETGPYIQYATARISSIFKKVGGGKVGAGDLSLLNSPAEKDLMFLLSKFSEVVGAAASEYRPSVLCRYLVDLTHGFNNFYEKCHILSEKDDLKQARLELIASVRQVLVNGLSLLGIEALDEM